MYECGPLLASRREAGKEREGPLPEAIAQRQWRPLKLEGEILLVGPPSHWLTDRPPTWDIPGWMPESPTEIPLVSQSPGNHAND